MEQVYNCGRLVEQEPAVHQSTGIPCMRENKKKKKKVVMELQYVLSYMPSEPLTTRDINNTDLLVKTHGTHIHCTLYHWYKCVVGVAANLASQLEG